MRAKVLQACGGQGAEEVRGEGGGAATEKGFVGREAEA